MKTTVLFLLLAVSFSASFAQISHIDTVYEDYYSNNVWVPDSKVFDSYNNSCLLLTTTGQSYSVIQKGYENQILETFTYSDGVHINIAVFQTWDTTNNVWVNAFKEILSYNASFKNTTIQSQLWVVNAWVNIDLTTNSYDGNGYLISTLDQMYQGPTLINESLDKFTNNAAGNPDTDLYLTWDSGTSSYDTSSKDTYTYNSKNSILTDLEQYYSDGIFTNEDLDTYSYDGNNYLLKLLDQDWDGTAWENNYQDLYTNNSNGSPSVIIEQDWDTDNNTWVNSTRNRYYYSTACSLPLSLLNFTADKNSNTVNLKWQTANEINTSQFAVERSTDGTNFADVGIVKANKTGTSNSYTFADNVAGIKATTLYYRLKMVDDDAKYTDSKIINISFKNNGGAISIKPNPASSYFIIQPSSLSNTAGSVTVFDMTGKALIKQTVNLNGEQKIDISTLPKGVYMVSILTNNSVTSTQKLVIE